MTDFANETLNNLVKQITAESTSTFIKSHLFSDELQGVPRFNWSFANQFTLLSKLYGQTTRVFESNKGNAAGWGNL